MFEKTGFMPADILLPRDIDFEKWSVVACDQYTSQPDYWEEAEKAAGSGYSSLKLIFPEIFLKDDNSKRIADINRNMEKYLKDGIFKEYKNSFILVEREINGKVREGIVGMVDLEDYDFSADSKSLIRATEGTVAERIPPRVKIRENAPLELPHIMLLIDDRENKVFNSAEKKEKLYDFELMMNGGKIRGYLAEPSKKTEEALLSLFKGDNPLVYAVGDGNHSLATAKTCYENAKKNYKGDTKNLPQRYALAEVVNIHSPALEFEPIHRVIFDADTNLFKKEMSNFFDLSEDNGQSFVIVEKGKEEKIFIKNPPHTLAVGSVQKFIDFYIQKHGGRVDYIHGRDVVMNLSQKDNTVGILLDSIDKSSLFEAVAKNGPLPRKTFSMGEANEKRYYIESRKIK